MARWVLVAVFEDEDEADRAQAQVMAVGALGPGAEWSRLQEVEDEDATIAILEPGAKVNAEVVWEESIWGGPTPRGER